MLGKRLHFKQLDPTPDEPVERPPPKLARRAKEAQNRGPASALRARESALFRPVRSIGAVVDGLPISVSKLGDASFVTASVGRGFQVFETEKLKLAYISPRFNEKVRAMTSIGEVVITALKRDIVVWQRLTELGRFRGHHDSATVLCTLGSTYLLSAAGPEAIVWQLSDMGLMDAETLLDSEHCILGPLARLQLTDFGDVTCIRHPPTYLNKVLLAGTAGKLQLWNVRSKELIHSFRCVEKDGISCLMEAKALDVVAVGCVSGRIHVVNIREDSKLFELFLAQGPVTSLAFRDDVPYLVSGSTTGDFVVWDLEKRSMHHMQKAHRGPVLSAIFLPKEPLLLTSSTDNAVKMWIFDTADGKSRYLKGRCGCPGQARRLQFYGEGDKELIVGGGFQGRGFLSKISFIQDQQNQEYSQASLKKMSAKSLAGEELPPVIDTAICQVRHFDWPCVVTAHNGLHSAMVWSPSHLALSPTVLMPPESGDSPVSAVAVSTCGNYCVLGLENGFLHKFNLQSGLHRGTIPKVAEGQADPDSFGVKVARRPAMQKAPPPPPGAHQGRVCGLVLVGAKVVSASSHPDDCCLKLWELATQMAIESIPLGRGRPGRPGCLLLRPFGSLVAVCLDDGTLPIVDLNSKSVVRSFSCQVPATDLAFAPDGRWLAASLSDGGLRVFDLPAARCIDSFIFAQPALGLCFSPSGAFLLTSHAKNNAIQVWANKFLFDPSLSAPLLRPEPTTPIHVDEPGAPEPELPEPLEAPEAAVAAPSTTTPLAEELLTLSDVAPSKVLATLHLELVKERNKLTEPLKPLPNAPFFLPTQQGVTPRFAAPLGEEEAPTPERPSLLEQITTKATGATSLPFQALLRKGLYDKGLEFLKSQTPSGVHLALEQIGPMASGQDRELEQGLRFFLHHVGQSHFADEVQAFLALFLAAHGEEIAASEELQALCSELATAQESKWSALNTRCQKARCFLGMLTQTQSQW